MFHMNYVIEGSGALVNEKGVEQPFKIKGKAFRRSYFVCAASHSMIVTGLPSTSTGNPS